MQKFKFYLGILGLLLSFVTMGEDNYLSKIAGKIDLSGGTYTARIKAAKAVVYADENMLSPIGYIANGKAIKVGNPRRINPNLVPLIVYGRLAFIEINDIQYENSSEDEYKFKKGAPLEHNFDLALERAPESPFQNNSAFLSLHAFSAGSDIKEIITYVDGEDKSFFTGFETQFVHRSPSTNIYWGLNLGYSGISSSQVSFNMLMLGPIAGFTPIKNPLFAVDFYGSLDFSIYNKLTIDNNDTNEPSGFIWGLQGNARVLLYPDNRFHFFVTGGFKKYGVVNYKELRLPDGNVAPGIEDIFGISGAVGFAMEFR